MSSQTRKLRVWNEYREVPAIHAAGIVSVFFGAAFLNFGWMLVVFAAYALLAIRSLRSRRIHSLFEYIRCLSLEASVLLFGLLYEVCFRSWTPVLPSLSPLARALLWLMLAAVLLSTKFFLITRIVDASSDPRWFSRSVKGTAGIFLAFVFLVASLAAFLLAQFGPNSGEIPLLILKALIPGTL